MSVVDKTVRGQTDALTFELDLRHSPKKVWRALTDPVLLAEWLLPTVNHKLENGAAFTLQAPPKPGWDGTVACKFMDIDTVVTFTLTPTDAGTLLSLVQSGFKADQKQNFGGARYGWNLMGGRLVELLTNLPTLD